MKKIKHSKYKNVSFLSEIIIKKITENQLALKGNKLSDYKKVKIERTIERLNYLYNECFKNKKKEIYKEFKIHKQILNIDEPNMTGRIIEKARSLYNEKVDKNKLNKEIYKVVRELRLIINNFDSFIKESFVENYKTYASIYKSLRYDLNCDLSDAVESEESIIDFINERNEKKEELSKYKNLSKPQKITKIYNLKESILNEVKDFDIDQKNIVVGFVIRDNKLFNKGLSKIKEGLNNFKDKEDIKQIIENLTIIESNPKLTQKNFDYACLANDILMDLEDEKTN